jgi:hypothetical protein
VAGLREYLMAVPAVGLGAYALWHWSRHWRRVGYVLLGVVAVLVLIAIVQLLIPPGELGKLTYILVQPPTEASHSSMLDGQIVLIRLISSVFASSKRFARFLLLLYPLLWAIFVREKITWARYACVLLAAIGAVISGSRESIILIGICELVLERRRALLVKLGLGAIALLVVAALTFAPQIRKSERLNFLKTSSREWKHVINYMTLGIVFPEPGQTTELTRFGRGIGRFGQGLLLVEEPGTVNPKLRKGIVQMPDPGPYKLLIDLGVIGTLLFAFLYGAILVYAWPYARPYRSEPLYVGAAAALWLWCIFFLKSHTVLGDIILHTLFWFYAGILFAVRRTIDLAARARRRKLEEWRRRRLEARPAAG